MGVQYKGVHFCMTQIGLRRFKNKYILISAISLFLLLGISFLVCGDIIKVLLSDAYANFAEKKIIIDEELSWELFLFDGIYYIGNIFPIFAIITAMPFWNEKNTFYIFAANRLKNKKHSMLKAVLSYGFMGGAAISLGFFLYVCVGEYFCIPTLKSISGFESIFNYSLYFEHPFLFMCFMIFTIYFLLGVGFAVMTCGVIMLSDNRITAIVFPLFVYVVGSYIGNGLGLNILQISSCTAVFCTENTTGQCFIPLISVAIIDLVLILIGLKKNEEVTI